MYFSCAHGRPRSAWSLGCFCLLFTVVLASGEAFSAPPAKGATGKVSPPRKEKAAPTAVKTTGRGPGGGQGRISGAPRLAPTPGPISLSIPKSEPKAASAASDEVEVLGQVRNLNMMLILRNKNEGINGFDIRKDYRREIPITNF